METLIMCLLIAAALFFMARTLRRDLTGGGCGCSGGSCGAAEKNARHGGTHGH